MYITHTWITKAKTVVVSKKKTEEEMECMVKYLLKCFLPSSDNQYYWYWWWGSRRSSKDGRKDEEEDNSKYREEEYSNDNNNTNNITSAILEETTLTTLVREDVVSGSDGVSAQKLQQQQQERWECKLCNVNVALEGTLKLHFRGKKHKRKLGYQLMMMTVDESSSFVVSDLKGTLPYDDSTVSLLSDGSWMCMACYVTCWDSRNFVDHLVGRKHAANIANE